MDAPFLDCGEPVVVEMRDEEVLSVQPVGLVGYARSEIMGPAQHRPWR